MFDSLDSEDETPAGRQLCRVGYGVYCLFNAVGFAMAVFRGHGATHLISAAIYLTMCLLALWWLISALRDGVPTRRTLSRHSMLLMLFWFLPGTFKLFSI
jgi:hypothetical protein